MNSTAVCETCKASIIKSSPKAREWDWFKGYLDSTVHFCPKHKNTEVAQKLFRLSRKPPLTNHKE